MESDLWSRIRGARIVQILAVYLGASWVILQIADLLQEALSLPEWLLPVAVILLLVGLLVIMATAWVQTHPLTDAREEAGEVPGDWEIAPADIGRAIRSGRLPHLTWGRAAVGGVMSLSLLFGVAGAVVLISGGPSVPLLGPTEAGAERASSGVAVLPFSVSGPGMEVYREGMVDLVSTNLDGVSGLRAIDSRTVLARWSRDVGEAEDPELMDALRVAAATGARYALVGSAVSTGSQVRLAADLWDLESREKIGSGRSEGSADDVLTLVDRLSVESLRELLRARGDQAQTDIQRLESVVTSSIPALTAYLEGEQLYRKARFREARGAFERAVADDSTFALAWWRLGETYGWLESAFAPGAVDNKARALRYIDRVPPREATLLRAAAEVGRGTVEHLAAVERHTSSFPDDPEGWYLLGEYYIHARVAAAATEEEMLEALRKAVALDPEFSPYYAHALRAEIGIGDSASFFAHLEELERLSTEEADRNRLVWDFFRGGPAERARAEAVMDTLNTRDLFIDFLTEVPLWSTDLFDEGEAVTVRLDAAGAGNPTWATWMLVAQGKLEAARDRAMVEGAVSPAAFFYAYATRSLGVRHPDAVGALLDEVSRRTCVDEVDCIFQTWLESALESASGAPRAHVELADRFAERLEAVPDTSAQRSPMEANLRWIRGVAALEEGDPARALRLLQSEGGGSNDGNVGVFYTPTVADAYRALGQHRQALRHYQAAYHNAFSRAYAMLSAAEVHETLGERDEAVEAYRGFLEMWRDADPGLEPKARAEAALARLGG